MITRYGMSERLGHIALEKDGRSFLSPNPLADDARERSYSDETAAAIDEEVRRTVDAVFKRTLGLLRDRRDILERTAQRLLEKETLDEAELAQLTAPGSRTSGAKSTVEVQREGEGHVAVLAGAYDTRHGTSLPGP